MTIGILGLFFRTSSAKGSAATTIKERSLFASSAAIVIPSELLGFANLLSIVMFCPSIKPSFLSSSVNDVSISEYPAPNKKPIAGIFLFFKILLCNKIEGTRLKKEICFKNLRLEVELLITRNFYFNGNEFRGIAHHIRFKQIHTQKLIHFYPLTGMIKRFFINFDPVHFSIRSCYKIIKRYMHK